MKLNSAMKKVIAKWPILLLLLMMPALVLAQQDDKDKDKKKAPPPAKNSEKAPPKQNTPPPKNTPPSNPPKENGNSPDRRTPPNNTTKVNPPNAAPPSNAGRQAGQPGKADNRRAQINLTEAGRITASKTAVSKTVTCKMRSEIVNRNIAPFLRRSKFGFTAEMPRSFATQAEPTLT